ncbi:MAG: hypothetical protein AAB262_12430 [Elusimicrobiota bacterium]
MTVTYQPNSDRPLAGIPRVDCMADVLCAMTAYDFREVPMCLAEDFFAALYQAVNALPSDAARTAWARLLTKRFAAIHPRLTEQEIIVAIADRLVEAREAWAQEKRTHYGELTR